MRRPEGVPAPERGSTAATESVVRPDPFETLDDLMWVIEALCPAWPPRPTFAGAGPFIL